MQRSLDMSKLISKIINFAAGLAQNTGGKVMGEPNVNPELVKATRALAAEGIVLLKNDGVLPIKEDKTLAVFGRVQYDYFYVGYGSGGDVKAPYRVNLLEGLKASNVKLDTVLSDKYEAMCKKNAPDEGFWGHWPLSFPELKLKMKDIRGAKERADVAMVVIGRAAGEDREQSLKKGSFFLTDAEKKLLDNVISVFGKAVVLIDAGNVIDLSWAAEYGDKISALIYAWQGGMESGNAVADVISGAVNPSGKLTDTIAINYKDYPSANNFGNREFNNYAEDIYVGYRYFETFAKDRVLFPFGYGLSYTTFDYETSVKKDGDDIVISCVVKNVGDVVGKDVVQLYVKAPEGALGKPARSLIAFAKTQEILPNEAETLEFVVTPEMLFSYDDAGLTGYKSCFIAEKGNYKFYLGSDVRSAKEVYSYDLEEEIVSPREEICAVNPDNAFDVLIAKETDDGYEKAYRKVATRTNSLKDRILDRLPREIPYTGDKGIKLIDVKDGKNTMDEFIAQLSLEELETLCHGDIKMNSSYGALGNAGAFAGVSASLTEKGVPAVITTDGPSGIRLMYYASLLPCGTAVACSWNEKLASELYGYISDELAEKGSDMLLAPGMNIHRDPLCGRNFEYFSEDPVVSGKIASAVVKGIQKGKASACPKHFACNNQETNRNNNDSRVSERALREIYLKGFEICIKESAPKSIMTSYNKVNGIWSHYNYDFCETVLRKDWGYEGVVITDWWMKSSVDPDFESNFNCGYRVRSHVDVLMPGGDRLGKYDNSLIKSQKAGGVTIAEMQRSAKKVLEIAISTKL